MNCRSILRSVIIFSITLCLVYEGTAFCQNTFERAMAKKTDSLLAPVRDEGTELYPNNVLQSLTAPSGWGGYGSYIFGGVGGIYPQVYRKQADLIASAGFCVGDPVKAVNFAASVNLTDVHKLTNFSANFVLSRKLFTGSSISAGALQMFASKLRSDAPGQTYYLAFSHAVQGLPSKTPGSSKLTYTIGIGSGRFYLKSPEDIAAGKGKYGTAVFGGVSYELLQRLNLNAEWSGQNLALSLGIRPFDTPLSVGLGVANITRYSADKPNMIFTIGYPLSLNRQ
ncbi:hypothetical protein BH09BAC6_BH09BAC6_26200 [soil metagenome]|jgi:hypothetical protein